MPLAYSAAFFTTMSFSEDFTVWSAYFASSFTVNVPDFSNTWVGFGSEEGTVPSPKSQE